MSSVYPVKRIVYNGRSTGILMQNENGPCPLLAISNILLLRQRMSIHPDIAVVTDETLVQMLSDSLQERFRISGLADNPNAQYTLQETLSKLPELQKGMDVNIRFGGITDYEVTSNIACFDVFGMRLVHGWLPSEEDQHHSTVSSKSYDQLVEMVIKKNDELDKPEGERDEETIRLGGIANAFIEETAPQLTYAGLFKLVNGLEEGELCVFFRNNHFSTLTKHDGRLFALLTDVGYRDVLNVAWESLADVDGDMVLVDGSFSPPKDLGRQARILEAASTSQQPQQQPAGEPSADADRLLAEALQAQENQRVHNLEHAVPQPQPTSMEEADRQLAAQLHQEEQQQAQAARARQQRQLAQQPLRQPQQHQPRPAAQREPSKSKCVVC